MLKLLAFGLRQPSTKPVKIKCVCRGQNSQRSIYLTWATPFWVRRRRLMPARAIATSAKVCLPTVCGKPQVRKTQIANIALCKSRILIYYVALASIPPLHGSKRWKDQSQNAISIHLSKVPVPIIVQLESVDNNQFYFYEVLNEAI